MKTRTFFPTISKENWRSPKIQEEIKNREAKESIYVNPSEIKLDDQSEKLNQSFARALTSLYASPDQPDENSEKIAAIIEAFLRLDDTEKKQVYIYLNNYMHNNLNLEDLAEDPSNSPQKIR